MRLRSLLEPLQKFHNLERIYKIRIHMIKETTETITQKNQKNSPQVMSMRSSILKL